MRPGSVLARNDSWPNRQHYRLGRKKCKATESMSFHFFIFLFLFFESVLFSLDSYVPLTNVNKCWVAGDSQDQPYLTR